MAGIHCTISSGAYTEAQTINADETRIFFAVGPTNQYMPETADRAVRPDGDEKARWTSLQAGAGDGTVMPSFEVIKCSAKIPMI
mmetsp:Transcript_16544/g.35866  ORF Transcript_16544/g.35866 Transcript_16544/m.35866 type:complete len:84 (-) Transcript_16544:364-615(-)